MNSQRRLSLEQSLYIVALLIGVFLRFYNLGATPLSDLEAVWANQSLSETLSDPSHQLGPQPGYILLTHLVFSVIGATDFSARLWSALAGSIMILAPYLVLRRVSLTEKLRLGLLILSFGLAIDPGLTTISRQAGSPIFAISFTTLTLAAWIGRQSILTGIFGGFVLLSGPFAIPGIISISIAGLLTNSMKNSSKKKTTPDNQNETLELAPWQRSDLATIFITGIITAFVVGTMFFRFPQALSAWLASIEEYVIGWLRPSGVPIGKMLLALSVYELFPLIFFLVGIARLIYDLASGKETFKSHQIFAIFWALIALLIVLIYPNRQVADLAWAVTPLWIIAAVELAHSLPVKNVHPVSPILAGFVFLLLSLFWFTLSAISKNSTPTSPVDIRLLVPLGTLILISLTTALVCLGWTLEIGLKGLVWGCTLGLLLYNFSVLWGSAQLRLNQPSEFWGANPGSGQNNLLLETLDFISKQETGNTGSLDILVTHDSPSLRWALRNYQNTQFVSEPALGELPSIVISLENQDFPSLAASYSGQDFVWWTWPGWNGALPPNLIRWLNYREAPILNQKTVLWVRSDILLGGGVPQNTENELELLPNDGESP